MERFNQPPKTECCQGRGKADEALKASTLNEVMEADTGELTGRKQESHPAKAIQPRDGTCQQMGTQFPKTEPKTNQTDKGEDWNDLPGSKSVAYEERTDRNLGGPVDSCDSNYERSAGGPAQRQEVWGDDWQGVRSAHSSLKQCPKDTETNEGADVTSQAAKETGSVGKTDKDWPTSLQAIAKKAVEQKKYRFGGLYRLLNEESLRWSFSKLKKNAAPGVDGVTVKEYEKNLDENLRDLVKRLKNKSYRAKLVRRKNIPKGEGKWRPLGIPALEDKMVQIAVACLLNAIYEADFLPCSHGYRVGKGPRQASRELADALHKGRIEFVVEADIKGYFDHIQHEWLLKMLSQRIADGALLGLINKWLKAGVLEETGEVVHPEAGTPQGGIVSPVLANVYLHYVLDLWFEHRVRKRNRGQSLLIRFADDFVCGFAYRHEAEQFMGELKERLGQFGLETAPEKTRMMRFGRGGGSHNGRFDFLGFEFLWGHSKKGQKWVQRRTSRKRLRRSVAGFTEWIKKKRHQKLGETMEVLASKYRGYWNYYGVRGNAESLEQFYQQTRRILCKWLNRRSQKKSYTQNAFKRLLGRFQIPRPKITETLILLERPMPGIETVLRELFPRYNGPESRA
jgi:RNA-directed DNA polymerase